MKQSITFPKFSGKHSKQAHCDLPEGTFEREFGREGFFGSCSHLYHKHAPTGWTKWEGELRPRAFDLNKMESTLNNPWNVPDFLYNNHVRIRLWNTHGSMPDLVRNADGDELLFIHAGKGELYCDFGRMSFRDGDYITLPRSTAWRLECSEPTSILMIESTAGSYSLPDKGMVGPHAVFDPAVFEVPAIDDKFLAQQHENEASIIIKHGSKRSVVTYPYNPLDAQGWKGDNVPVKVNWRNIRPLMSHSYHLPPSAHTTFIANRFVVCTFVPRPVESDAGALKVPFYHSNNDYDEVLFYHAGDFFSRDNIKPGMVTLHPAGFPHGPHPKAYEKSMNNPKTSTNEVAVMIDTRDALKIADLPNGVEWHDYVKSWIPNT